MNNHDALTRLRSLTKIRCWFAERKTNPVHPSPKFVDEDVENLMRLYDACSIAMAKTRIALGEYTNPYDYAVSNEHRPAGALASQSPGGGEGRGDA